MLCPIGCPTYLKKGKCSQCGGEFKSPGKLIKKESRKRIKRKSDGLDGLAGIANKIPNVILYSRSTTWMLGKKK